MLVLKARDVLRKKSVKNFFSLMSVQLVINLTSLILVPLLSRNLGPKIWGIYLLSQSVMNFVTPLMDFGFDYTGTRFVSQNRESNLLLSKFGSTVVIVKSAFSLIILLIGFLFYLNYPPLNEYPEFLFLALTAGIISGLTPWWYFQGIERMEFPSFLTIGLYLVYGVSIFIIINEPDDGWKVLLIYLAINLLINLILFSKMFSVLTFTIPRIQEIVSHVKEASILFLARVSDLIYGSISVIILGLFVSPVGVSYYGNSEKVLKVPRISINTLLRVLYPKLAKLMVTDPKKADAFKRKILLVVLCLSLPVCAMVSYFSDEIVLVLFGEQYLKSAEILRWMIWIIPLFALNKMVGILWFVSSKKDKVFLKVNMIGTTINILLLIIFLSRFGLMGIVYSLIISEFTKSIIVFFYARRT